MVKFGSTRWIARQVIPDLYKIFGSANRALSYLREKGLGYRRKDFLADWREILDFGKKKDTWKYVRKDLRVTEAAMTPVQYDMRRKYRWVAEVTYIDEFGERKIRSICITTDKLLTPREAEEALWTEATVKEGWYQIGTVEKVEITGVLRRVKEEVGF